MAWQQFWRGRAVDNKSLVQMLQLSSAIRSPRIASVMEELDRADFVHKRELAYVDSPIPIGYNATISAPHMHALCLDLLEKQLQPGMRALDVGAGTGYLTAAFALLVGEQGRAIGVEHIPQLVQLAADNIAKTPAADLLNSGRLSLHVADGREGWPSSAPYDAIHVGAAAASQIPQPLIDQLKAGGRLVIPVGDSFQDLRVIDKLADGTLSQWTATSVRYVPLTSREAQLRTE